MTSGDDGLVEESRLRAIGMELMRLSRRRATAYPGSVLGDSAFRILLLLVEEGPRSLRELADDLQLERSTMSRQVNAAIGRGPTRAAARTCSARPGGAGAAWPGPRPC